MSRNRLFARQIVSQGVVCGVFLVLWQLLAVSGTVGSHFLPTPLQVGRAVKELYDSGDLAMHAGASLLRVLAGFSLAALVAVPLGLVLGWYRQFGSAFSLLIEILRTISPIAWIPLAILWFGIGDVPAIFIIFMAVFFPVLVATAQAPSQIDSSMIKAAVNLGARRGVLLRKVILPASFPNIVVGLKIGLGIAWVVVVAAEMVGMQSGLGFMILDARNFLRTDMVMAGMVIIGIIGFLLDLSMRFCERKLRRGWDKSAS